MATYNNIKKIKIGDNVFNLYDSGNSGGTITSVKTTAGAHTTVNVTSGAVSFNVPTTAAHVGAVPTTRKVNNKALSSDITLTAPDVGAAEVQKLTQAEYDALTTISDDTIYFITDGSASTRNPYLDMNYPIGSYYETSDANFDPNTVWGGTWNSEVVTNDEVVEEVNSYNGTTSGWSYRKWKSGISECWGRTVETSYAMTNAYGNGYYVLKDPIATFPSIFTSPPIVNITRTNVGTGGGLISASIYKTTATSCSAYVFDSKSNTMSLQFSMYAKGLWKTYTAPITIYKWHRTT